MSLFTVRPFFFSLCFSREGAQSLPHAVAGVEKLYSQVTDEDHELMTPEEYTAYFEIFQTRSEG